MNLYNDKGTKREVFGAGDLIANDEAYEWANEYANRPMIYPVPEEDIKTFIVPPVAP